MQSNNQGVSYIDIINRMLDSCYQNSQMNTLDLLNQLLTKNNLPAKKISEPIFEYFDKKMMTFQNTYQTLMHLMKSIVKIPGRQHFKSYIFSGIQKYIMQLNVSDQFMEEAFCRHEEVDYQILGQYLKLFSNQQLVIKYKQEILDKVQWKLSSNFVQFKRALKILSSLGLKKEIKIKNIIQQIKRHIQIIKFGDIMFYFPKQQLQLYSKLINQLSYENKKPSNKLAVDIVEKYKLNPQNYPQLLLNLENKGILYNYRQYPLYFCIDKFSQSTKYMAHLVRLLMESNRFSQAKSIIHQYDLENVNFIKEDVLALRNQSPKKIVNILKRDDDFGATQLRVLKTASEDYLELINFGIQEQSIIWVDDQNNNLKHATKSILKAKFIGFDTQSSGGIHSFQTQLEQTIQIATQQEIFIFDIPSLENNTDFISLIQTIFYENEDQTVIGHAAGGDLNTICSMTKSQKKMKKIEDTQKIFKQQGVPPISLKDIVKKLFSKSLSKYEQCSGWNNRPLRRAQLHYAALDAFVLIKIYKKEGLQID